MIFKSEVSDLVYQIEQEPFNTHLLSHLISLVKKSLQDFQEQRNKLQKQIPSLQKYPIIDNFALSFDPLTQSQDLVEAWYEYGFVVGKNVCYNQDSINAIQKIHSVIDSFDIKDESSYIKDNNGTPIISRGFFEIYHDDCLAQIRQNIRLYLYHCLLWNTPYLWTSFDRLGLKTPSGENSIGLNLHVDQNPTVHPNFTTIQGVLALDFEKAKTAKESGVKTIVYDTLLWYWKDKNIVHYADYYITQDFYGVKEIVESLELDNTLIIPPLIQKKEVSSKEKNLLLINFGGLENPFWDIHVTAQYIDNILSTILPILEKQFNEIRIVCSKKHLNYLKKYPVTSASYQEMQQLLQEAKFIIATSGLGNIYEIANYQIPSLFLPPVNDSQGQQLEILQQVGLIDNCLNWKDFQSSINYFDEQQFVLNKIKYEIENFDKNSFSNLFIEKNYANLDLKSLFDEFGDNGSLMLSNYLKLILK